MKLKEALQAQNKIEELFHFVSDYLGDEKNLVSVTEKHLRSKAAEGQSDEKINIAADDKFPTDKVIDFLLMLIDEREKLAKEIHAAKKSLKFDFDSTIDLNQKRRQLCERLHTLRQFKNSSVLEKNSGVGYVFNKDGNQTSYHYDIERVKKTDFDRKRLGDLITKLQKRADKVSEEIDSALISTNVDYKLPFDLHAGNLEILDDYVARNGKPIVRRRRKSKESTSNA